MNKIFNPTQFKYISSFRKESDDLLKEIETYAEENNVPILFWQSAGHPLQLDHRGAGATDHEPLRVTLGRADGFHAGEDMFVLKHRLAHS